LTRARRRGSLEGVNFTLVPGPPAKGMPGRPNPKKPMHWNIRITVPHSGELGEAIEHEDHLLVASEYHYEAGTRLEVAVHKTDDPHWHIFTDLDSGHRFKIPADKYERVS